MSLPTKSNTRILNLVDRLSQPTSCYRLDGKQSVLGACKPEIQVVTGVDTNTSRLI